MTKKAAETLTEPGNPSTGPSEIESVREHTLRTLREYDVAMSESARVSGGEHRSLAEMWERSWKIRNTNELLRTNLLQIQVMFQDALDRIYDRHAVNSKRVDEIKKVFIQTKAGDDWYRYRDYQRKVDEEERILRDDMIKLGRLLKGIFSEYRQAEADKASSYSISEINLLRGIIVSVLRQEIRQRDHMERISEKLEEAVVRVLGEKQITIET